MTTPPMAPDERASLVAASPLFSATWWSHARGRAFASMAEAALDYVELASSGRRALPPHPLFCRRWLATHGSATPPGEDPLSWWLRHHVDRVPCHPAVGPGVPELTASFVADCLAPLPASASDAGAVLLGAVGDDLAVLELVAALRDLPLVIAAGEASAEIRTALVATAVLLPHVQVVDATWAPALVSGTAVRVAPGTRDLTADGVRELLDAAPALPVVVDDAGLVLSPRAAVGRHPRDLADFDVTSTMEGLPVVAGEAGARVGRVLPDVVVRGPVTEDKIPGTLTPSFTPPRPRARDGLRWVIDTAVVWRNRERWGDWHFAQSLAAALERLGQHVAVDGREARGRVTRADDNVVLSLRGLDEVAPTPGAVNLMWVISHPDLVTDTELHGADRVFAASIPWARAHGADPLLQCTDSSRFRPHASPGDGPDLLFVGNAREADRPILTWAEEAGLKVAVYGAGWRDRLPRGWLRGRLIPNAELSAAYGSAGVVLNDHHEDMRVEGFLSNRLFDAVASGACVVSDPVAGAAELFTGSVVEVDGPEALAGVVRDRPFPDLATRRETAERIRAEHSFDARARELVAVARSLRG